MRHSCRLLLVIVVLFISAALCFADDVPPPPMEWGKVAKSDLTMKNYPADTNASALILCDYGETSVNNDLDLDFTRHVRIKILNAKGVSWGTVSLLINTDSDHGERIHDIEGLTWTLDADGEPQKMKFNDDEVYVEKIGEKLARYKFSLPGVTPGCVIEIRYSIVAKSFFLVRDWSLQYSEPVLWSEYRMTTPTSIAFASLHFGYERLAVDEQYEFRQHAFGDLHRYLHSDMPHFRTYRWAAKNLEGLRDEPYITTTDDYLARITLQFAGYADPEAMSVHKVLNSWEDFVKEMLDDASLGKRMKPTGKIEEEAARITAGMASTQEKVNALYSWISHSIVWDGRERVFSGSKLNDVLESKKGNSADINLLLIAMLRALHIPSEAVILSTRSNGKIQELYPMLSQFNYLIAQVRIDSTVYNADATSAVRAFGVLPSKVLGVRALTLVAGEPDWRTLAPVLKTTQSTMASLAVDADGNLSGTMLSKSTGYANLDVRNQLLDQKKLDVAKRCLASENANLSVDSVDVIMVDSAEASATVKAMVSAPNYGQPGAEFLYLNPHVVRWWKDNPLKKPKRKFPLNYNFAREYTAIVNIVLPDSFEVKEIPANKALSVFGLVEYRRQAVVDESRLQLVTKYAINALEIDAKYYPYLKELYSSIISCESEQVVLKRKPALKPPEPSKAVDDRSIDKARPKPAKKKK